MDELKDIILHDLGEGLSEAKLIEWKVSLNSPIKQDQIIALLETAKAIIELPSPYAGTVTTLHQQPNTMIQVGAPIAQIQLSKTPSLTPTEHKPLVGKAHHEVTLLKEEGALRHKISPLSKHGTQHAMASQLRPAKAVIAASLFDDMPVHTFNNDDNITAQCIDKVIHALRAHPRVNAHFTPTNMQLVPQEEIHLGIAFNDDNQLKVPVIKQIEQYSLQELNTIIASLKKDGMRSHYVASADVKPTFTISNIGSLGGRYGTPVLIPPAVAILAIGRIEAKPVLIENQWIVRHFAPLSLTFDHRALTGADGCHFLSALCTLAQTSNT